MKAIILNGPPRAGKDTFQDLLLAEGALNVGHRALIPFCYKHTLCRAAAKRYGVDEKILWALNADTTTKDESYPELGGKSPRQTFIYESEEVIKKEKGEMGVAIQTFENIRDDWVEYQLQDAVLITASGGFNVETDALMNFFGIDRSDIFIVRIDRNGYTFEAVNDSREYLKDPDLAFRNDHTIEDMKIFIPVIQQFLDRD